MADEQPYEGEKLKLHELSDLALDVERMLDRTDRLESEGDRENTIREALERIDQNIEESAAGLGALVINRRADARALAARGQVIEARGKQITDRAKALANSADRLADYIAGCLAARGPETQRVGAKGAPVTVTLSKESQAKVEVIDARALPAEHLTAVIKLPADTVPPELKPSVTAYEPREGLVDAFAWHAELPPGLAWMIPTRAIRFR